MASDTAYLNPEQLVLARTALLAPASDSLIDGLVALNRFGSAPTMPQAARDAAHAIGWLDHAGHFTEAGQLASDSLREYRFWLERDRTTHGESNHPAMARGAYDGKAVLEVGCGFGANLFSIAQSARRAAGVEPMAMYRQMSAILGEREGMAPLEIVDGLGEALPFAPESFDVIVCYSSHQYMDIRKAFKSMASVLRAGGELQLMCGTLDQFLSVILKDRIAPRAVKHLVEVYANTRAYQWFGRRIRGDSPGHLNARPVYAEEKYLRRWLDEAGLAFRDDLLRRVNTETFIFADKPRI